MLYAKIVKFYTIHKYYCILFSVIKYINPNENIHSYLSFEFFWKISVIGKKSSGFV